MYIHSLPLNTEESFLASTHKYTMRTFLFQKHSTISGLAGPLARPDLPLVLNPVNAQKEE